MSDPTGMPDPAMPDPAMLAAIKAALLKFNTQLWTFYAIAVAIVILRTWARVKSVGFKNLRPDDYIIWIAIFIYTTQTTLAYFAVNYGQGLANSAMTDGQRANLSPDSQEWKLRVWGSKIQVVGWTSYVMLIFTLKLAILFFYLRLMEGLSYHYRLRIWIGFGMLIATWIASLLAIYIPCRPLHLYWQINPGPGNLCQGADSRSIVWTTFAASVITDFYLIYIPLPMLWGTKLPLIKKIGASFVLGAGVFVLLCSMLKTIFVTTDSINGAQLAGEWGTREAFASVITTNLPMLFPLLRSWFRPLLGSRLASTRSNFKQPSPLHTIGGGGSSGRKRSNKGPGNTSVSYFESQESIIGGDVMLRDLESGNGNKGTEGIMVVNDFVVQDDKVRMSADQRGHRIAVEGDWTNLGRGVPGRAQ